MLPVRLRLRASSKDLRLAHPAVGLPHRHPLANTHSYAHTHAYTSWCSTPISEVIRQLRRRRLGCPRQYDRRRRSRRLRVCHRGRHGIGPSERSAIVEERCRRVWLHHRRLLCLNARKHGLGRKTWREATELMWLWLLLRFNGLRE